MIKIEECIQTECIQNAFRMHSECIQNAFTAARFQFGIRFDTKTKRRDYNDENTRDNQDNTHLSLLFCPCTGSRLKILTCDRVSCNTKNPSKAANKQTAANRKQRTKISRVHENQ